MDAPVMDAAALAQLGTNPAMLEQLLLRVFVNDTDQIKLASEALKLYTKESTCVPPLVQQMRSSQHEQARQLAAVLLKKKLMVHWKSFSQIQQDEVKGLLLQAVGSDPSRKVRHIISCVIAKVAKAMFASPQGWQELLDLVGQCAQQAQSEDHRELAFVILEELTETVGDVLSAHFTVLKDLFLNALKDPSSKVQTAALKASSTLLGYLSLDESGMQFQALVQPTMQVAKDCLARNDETTVVCVLGVFADLCSSPLPLIHPHMQELVTFLLLILRTPTVEMNVKDSAALVLSQMADAKPRQFVKAGKLKETLGVLMELVAGYEGSAANALFNYQALDDEDEDEDYDGPNPQSIAQSCMDNMALSLPTKHTFPPLMELCNTFLGNPSPHMRKAAVAALGVMSEGCQEPIKARLGEILPKILELAVDDSHHVRECACFCLGQFAEHCQPEILDHSDKVLPIVFQLLDDATDNVKGVSCYVLEMFCENLEPETVMPFLDPLMTRLVQMLHTPKKGIKEMSVAAIAATAISADVNFLPYLVTTCSMLGPLMALTDEKLLTLRGRALECMGHIALAVNKENFKPYTDACIVQAVEGLKIDSMELHEFSYTFFANLAKVLGEDMGQYMGQLLPHLLSEIQESDGVDLDTLQEREAVFGDQDDDDDDEEVDEEFGSAYMNVRTAELDKKKAALVALGSLAEHAPRAFYPHLSHSMEVLIKKVEYWHGDVRTAVSSCLEWMVHVSHQAYPPETEWQRGQPTPLPAPTASLCGQVVDMLLTFMKDDIETQVVATACMGLKGVVEMVGPAAISNKMQEVMEVTCTLLQEKGPCFGSFPGEDEEEVGEEEEEEEEDEASDGNVASACCDLIGAYARVIGPAFSESFDVFLPGVMKYARGSRPAADRAMAVGCFAEVFENIDGQCVKYIGHVLPMIKMGLADSNAGVRRNAAFCAGTLAQGGGETVVPYYQELLQALHPMFSLAARGTEAGVVDNAASAVARMTMAAPAAVPISQVLPVLLSALPLKNDQSENESVYTCVLGLLNMKHPEALQMLDSILAVIAQALSPGSKVQDEIQATLVTGLQALAGELGGLLNAAIEKLPAEPKHQLVQRLNQPVQ